MGECLLLPALSRAGILVVSIRPGNMSEAPRAVVMPGHSAFVMPRYEAPHYEVPEMLRLYSDQYSKHVLFCYAKSRPASVMPRHEASRFE